MTGAPRVGLVLGGGGVVGGAFHAGVLAALECALHWDARKATVVVGTSAGAMSGALLRAGLAPSDLLARATGQPLSPEGTRLTARLGAPPAPPRLDFDLGRLRSGPAAPRLLAAAARWPWRVRPGALLAAALPEGRTPTDALAGVFSQLFREGWPSAALWLCAVSLRDGRRAVFGRGPEPPPAVGAAVAASCAIPGVFAPVEIAGVRYVDGGVHSPTNADVLRTEKLDLVLVSSPMSASGRGQGARPDVGMRQWSRLRLRAESARLRAVGIPVVRFEPTAEDLRVMALDPLDPERRAPVARHVFERTLASLEGDELRERLAALRR